jgi:alpha-D-ribose 1-methylphosphonate 5-triphosphate synthase subunit PhnL
MDKNRDKIVIYVAGTTHNGRQKLLKKLYVKYCLGKTMKISLKHEKGNEFDIHAMKILLDKKCIGYVPMRISKLIHTAYKQDMVKKVRLYDIHLNEKVFGASVIICI